MKTVVRPITQDQSLQLRVEHRPEIDLDKLAVALLSLVRRSTAGTERPRG